MKCPICDSASMYAGWVKRDCFGEDRKLYRCDKCDHIFVGVMPCKDVIDGYYQELQTEQSSKYKESYSNRLNFIRKKFIDYLWSGKGVLEVGPGSIGLLPLLKKRQKYYFFEKNVGNKRSIALEAKRLEIIAAEYEMNGNIDEIDIVISVSCLEHFSNLNNFIDILNSIRHPHKIIVIIGVPMAEFEICEEAKVAALINYGILPVDRDHLHHFSEKSLSIFLRKHDLDIKETVFPLSQFEIRIFRSYQKAIHREFTRIGESGVISGKNMLKLVLGKVIKDRFLKDYDFYVVAQMG